MLRGTREERRDDRDLIAASLVDPSVFVGVFERHYDQVRRYLQRRAGMSAGEELAAETFEVAFSRRRSFDPRYPSARPWLFGIATNLFRHHQRDLAMRQQVQGRLPVEREVALDPDLEGRLDATSIAAELRRQVDGLSDGQRDVLLLFALADLGYAEIGAALKIPLGTVRSRLSRARRSLQVGLLEIALRAEVVSRELPSQAPSEVRHG